MKQRSVYFDEYKIFGVSIVAFYGLMALDIAVNIVFSVIVGMFDNFVTDSFNKFYETVLTTTGIATFIAVIISVLLFLIVMIWCTVISKKDKETKIFSHPLVIINLILTIAYPLLYGLCCVWLFFMT